MTTGWDNGLCQDYNGKLGRWFANRLGARYELKQKQGDEMTAPIDLPPLPIHPDPQAFNWSAAERWFANRLGARYELRQPQREPNMITLIKYWCETCQGVGHIDTTLGGIDLNGSKNEQCPDCDGNGYYTISQIAQPALEYQQVAYMWEEEGFAGSPRICYHDCPPSNVGNVVPLYRKLSAKVDNKTDITERLRRLYTDSGTNHVGEAADLIDKLRVHIKKLEAQPDQ